MEVSQPIQHGLIQDFDAVGQLIQHAFKGHLGINPKEHPIMIAEPTFQPPQDRRKVHTPHTKYKAYKAHKAQTNKQLSTKLQLDAQICTHE